MKTKLLLTLFAAYAGGAAVWLIAGGVVSENNGTELLNVSYDPTRELRRDLNQRFVKRYQAGHGVQLKIKQSHGGSGSQARAGLVFANLYTANGWLGNFLVPLGIEGAYSRLGIVLVLTFTGFPFVVRTVQPILEGFDAETAGAFRRHQRRATRAAQDSGHWRGLHAQESRHVACR